ncbi:hypothetical protein [Streptomyces sp. NPDC047869]|uniref:hypothetical protein n=1 Tax=Streptomyces sp. NPDC047869 TaxID=3154709 RepID=UPI003454849A
MFRGRNTRTTLTLLTAVLLALQFFTSAGPFAAAHTFGEAEAKAWTGMTSSAQRSAEQADPYREPGRPKEPTGTPHTRDRHRAPAAGCAREHPLISRRTAAPRSPAPAGDPHHRATRSSRAHSPAALQVFRR